MKIKNYLAIVILVCLTGGYLMEAVLSGQYNKVHAASSRYNQSLLWQKDLERLVADVSQYLISVDLILGSDETYLVRGALNKGRFIVTSLDELAAHQAPMALDGEIAAASSATTSINGLLQKAAVAEDSNRFEVLSAMLEQSDAISGQLVQELSELRSLTDNAVEVQAVMLGTEEKNSSLVQASCFATFSLVVLVLWYWSNRQISNPLRELTRMANASEKGLPFIGVERGPREVMELSENTKRLTNSLSYQATHDALTDLYNRREFERVLTRLFSAANTKHCSTTHVLCFIDLDHFKIVNDTCGHAAGDELLAQVARLIQSSVRAADTVARLGGDEFAILLNSCDVATALEICNKIRNTIMEVRYQWEGEVYRISASIGIAEMRGKDATMEDLLNAADTACKVAKDSGRDRVHVFEIGDEVLA
ncbi:MAG: GGDEF domain-containing protein, partial [Pseudomonadales bacterium]